MDKYFRELDYAIAREIFGYKHYQFKRTNGTFTLFLPEKDALAELIKSHNPIEVESTEDALNAPLFSTDITCSKKLRDRMFELGWRWSIYSPWEHSPWKLNGYSVMFWKDDLTRRSAIDVKEEVAVALAALAAVRGGEPMGITSPVTKHA